MRGHYTIANEKERLEKIVNGHLKAPSDVEKSDLRNIQDMIFLERCKAPMIPDFIYGRLLKRYSDNTRAAIEQLTGDDQ